MKNKILLVASVVVVSGVSALADESAIQLSLTPDIALESRSTVINGFALDVWGENEQHSFNLGFINGSTGDSSGLSVGLANYDESYTGVQWSVVNLSRDQFTGWQAGFVNCSQGSFTGLQSGGLNISEQTTGVQIGFINYSENLNGIQIGFANIAENNPWFSELPDKFATGFPIVNWSF